MNGHDEILARCGYCDFISYENLVREHVKQVHESTLSSSNDENKESAVAECNQEAVNQVNKTNVVEEETNSHHWNDSEIKLLLTLYSDNRQDFDGKKVTNKSLWQRIAQEMNKNGCPVTWEQCDNKFKNLKKTYKKVIDNNSQTGSGSIYFKYFDIMDSLFSKNPEIHPVSECSSMETVMYI